MDKEHAKFILSSYRPDGADANDPDFADALQLAAEDRELGEWLANERAHDAMFTTALSEVDIPSDLRDEILSVLEHDQSSSVDQELDGMFMGALSSVQAPAGLRDQILSAMEVEKESQAKNITKFPVKWTALAAIAAMVMLSAVFVFFPNSGDKQQIAMHSVQLETGSLINTSFDMQTSETSLKNVNQWLVSEGLPEAKTIPQGLIDMKTKGGRKVTFDNGLEASMIFFEKKDVGDFYLMILEADSVKDLEGIAKLDQITLKRCKTCPLNHFSVTSWKDENKVYMLLTKEKEEKIMQLF